MAFWAGSSIMPTRGEGRGSPSEKDPEPTPRSTSASNRSNGRWSRDELDAEPLNGHGHSGEGYRQHRPDPGIEQIQPAEPHHAA